MIEQVRGFLKKVLKYISKPEMRVLPGQLAFFMVVSLIPLLALVGTIAGYLSVSTDKTFQMLDTILPFTITENLVSFASGKGMTFNIAVFFISAFILASNGCHSMIITSNEIYYFSTNQSNYDDLYFSILILIFIYCTCIWRYYFSYDYGKYS